MIKTLMIEITEFVTQRVIKAFKEYSISIFLSIHIELTPPKSVNIEWNLNLA
jgi:hypothetical protein